MSALKTLLILALCIAALLWVGVRGGSRSVSDEAPVAVQEEAPAEVAPKCGDSVLQSTQAEIAMSPRDNEDAERLVLRSSEALVASEDRYQRVVADLAAIHAAHPEPGARRVFGHFGTHMLIIELPPAIIESAAAGEYKALDCLNEWYGGRIHSVLNAVKMIFVEFPALYHPLRLVEAYSQVPDVTLVEANAVAGDGDDITLCDGAFGGAHRYLFRHADGNCLDGCLNIRYRGYEVTPGGAVTELEPWTARRDGEPVADQPSWVQPDCFQERASAYFLSPDRPAD